MPETVADVAHAIDHLLRSTCLKPTWRLRVLDYVRSGYTDEGQRIDRSDEQDRRMKTLECEECQESPCREDCPVKAYRDLLRAGDCVPVLTD
jgi:Fe-S-cluster-containing dehydrogenase component